MATDDLSLKAHPPSALPRGTRLGEFELRHVLGIGGFGIVYLAFDHALEREVAVKEYLPEALVGRTATLHVSLRSQSDADTFALGLKSFVNEARLLAHFDHPSLLKVLRFWEAHGTAYMAMPVLRGHTVKHVRHGMSQPPDEAWVRALLDPLLGAVERLHAEGVFHRDIAPDNIQIEPDGHPVLLDFGAARRVISDKTQSLTAILKPAYAPIEQYAEAGSVKQGPWTDLYALGATLHYVLLARPPLPATARAVHDDLPPLSARDVPGCSAEFLNIIDWMLAPRPADRPQSVAALRDVLAGRAPAPRRRAAEPVDAGTWERTIVHKPAHVPAPMPSPEVLVASETTHAATMVMPRQAAPADVGAAAATSAPSRPVNTPHTLQVPASAVAPRSRLLPALLGVAVLAVIGAAVALGMKPGAVSSPALAASASELAAAAASAPAEAAASAADVAAAGAASTDAVPAAASSLPVVQAGPVPTAPTLVERKPAPSRPTAPAAVPAATTLLQTGPATATAPPEAVQPARSAATEATPAAAPLEPAPKPVLVGPEAICAGRNQLAYFICMERECLRSEFNANQHPDCRKWRAGRPADGSTY